MILGCINKVELTSRCSWTVSTNLNSIDHAADGILCDVIQAQLKGRHHHAGLQLAPRGQQQGVGAETQLLLLTSHLPWTERLGGAQRVLRLEAMLKAQTRHTDSQLHAANLKTYLHPAINAPILRN